MLSPAKTPFAIFLAFSLCAAILLPLAVAGSEDEEAGASGKERGRDRERSDPSRGPGHEKESDEDERDVHADVDKDKADVELERREAEHEDHVHMDFQSADARFRLQFQGRENDTKTAMRLEARLGDLVEFRDANSNQRYDPGESIVSGWSLGDEGDNDVKTTGRAEWQPLQREDIVLAGQPGQKIVADAKLGPTGLLELRIYVFGDFVDLGNTTLRPTSAKIDIEIRNYPFLSNGTRLGLFLETRTQSKFKWSHEHEEMGADDDGVAATQEIDGKPVSLLFTWKETADVDGKSTPVYSTLIKSREELSNGEEGSEIQRREVFVLSYERGSLIVHDPEAFVSIQSLSIALPIGNPLLVLAGVAVAAGVVIGTLGPRMRRRL